jgi:hypothetical protein
MAVAFPKMLVVVGVEDYSKPASRGATGVSCHSKPVLS